MKYYTYVLINPRNDQVFYVGKGQNNRMYKHEKEVLAGRIPNDTNTKLANKIKKILATNLQIKYKKVFETDIGQNALFKEKELIKEIGLENLCNLTEGGEGTNGMLGKKHSEKTRQKISKAAKGNKNALGYKHTTEQNKAKSKRMQGKQNGLGHKHSKETRQKMSKAKKGNTFGSGNKGRTLSEEHKRKIGNSNKKITLGDKPRVF